MKKKTARRSGDTVAYAELRKKARRVYGKAIGKHQERIKEKLTKATKPKKLVANDTGHSRTWKEETFSDTRSIGPGHVFY